MKSFISRPNQGSISNAGIPTIDDVRSATYDANLALMLEQGGDALWFGDSISCYSDSYGNTIEKMWYDYMVANYSKPGLESGYGLYMVGSKSLGVVLDEPTNFHEKTFTATKTGENFYWTRMSLCGTGGPFSCRFAYGPSIDGRQIKKIELVYSTFSTGNVAPSVIIDTYCSDVPLVSGDALITPGTGGSETHLGITGISRVFTPGNVSNSTISRAGIEGITFDGVTHNPVIQITSALPFIVLGVILYWNDDDTDSKAVRIHRNSGGGNVLFGQRNQTASPTMDTAGIFAWRSYMRDDYNYGISSSSSSQTCNNLKLMVLEIGINDYLIWMTSPTAQQTFSNFIRDTVDMFMTTSDKGHLHVVISYCPAGVCATWRKGLSGTTIINSWILMNDMWYSIQAKYPDRIRVTNIDSQFGYKTYLNAVPVADQFPDQVHTRYNGPKRIWNYIKKYFPKRTTFLQSTGLNGGFALSSGLAVAMAFDRKVPINYGSLGGSASRGPGAIASNRARRSFDGKSMRFTGAITQYGMNTSFNITAPTGDFTIFVRVKITTDPGAGIVYTVNLFGDNGGAGGTFQVRLGYGGAIGNVRKISCSAGNNGNTGCTTAIGNNVFAVCGVVRTGANVRFFIDGVFINQVAATAVTATAMPFKIADETNGKGLTGEVSHVLLHSTLAFSDADMLTVGSNLDQFFTRA